jgi:2-iminobutanoate/2-iminopropanoate deaminase
MKTIISTTEAPAAIGPYSQAVQVDNLVFLSGQIGFDPKTGQLVSENVAEQAHQVFKNIMAVAAAAKADLSHVVKLTIFLVDMDDFSHVNAVMQEYFSEPYPARSTVAVKALPRNARVEVEAIIAVS